MSDSPRLTSRVLGRRDSNNEPIRIKMKRRKRRKRKAVTQTPLSVVWREVKLSTDSTEERLLTA